jgi:hypothetical protein
MKKISSAWIPFYKWVFPLVWFGFLAFMAGTIIVNGAPQELPILIAPLLMAVFGFVVMKKLVWVLADEVYDCGDYLIVRNRGEEERIELSNIMNVSAITFMNPPQITLRLITPSRFGSEITFSPAINFAKFTLNPFAKNPIAEDLIVRAHRARTRS